jgi:hypothetical protein
MRNEKITAAVSANESRNYISCDVLVTHHNDGSICHGAHLVAIVPPGSNLRILGGVLPKPVICLTIVIKHDTTAVGLPRDHDDRRAGIGLRDGPNRVLVEQIQ